MINKLIKNEDPQIQGPGEVTIQLRSYIDSQFYMQSIEHSHRLSHLRIKFESVIHYE